MKILLNTATKDYDCFTDDGAYIDSAASYSAACAIELRPPAAHNGISDTSPSTLSTPCPLGCGRRDDDVTTRIAYSYDTRDYACYATVGGKEELIGYARNHSGASGICREYKYNFYLDRHTPERAAEIALEAEPAAIYARPAGLAEPVYAAPATLADAPLPAELSAGPDAFVGATAPPFDHGDDARRNAQARITGEALMYEFRTNPAAFLTMLDGFSDRARQAVTRATAAYLEEPVSEVVELWGESWVRAVALGLLP